MSDTRVLITCPQMQNCLDSFQARLDDHGVVVHAPAVLQQPSEQDLIEMIGEFDGMIAGDDPLTSNVLERAGRLRVISKWGVGTDGIDLDAAARLGIRVTNTPNMFGNEVADVAAGYLVLLARGLHRIDASVREGGWLKIEGRSLTGRGLGIIGFGNIGQAVARRGIGFGMSVRVHDVDPSALERAAEVGATAAVLDHVFDASDYLVLCCALTPDTRHLINDETLGLMPSGSHIVNVARGGLIDEAALVRALDRGHIRAAALDVFEAEPLPPASDLRRFEQCIFGTHNGSNTREAVLRASEQAVSNLLEGLE